MAFSAASSVAAAASTAAAGRTPTAGLAMPAGLLSSLSVTGEAEHGREAVALLTDMLSMTVASVNALRRRVDELHERLREREDSRPERGLAEPPLTKTPSERVQPSEALPESATSIESNVAVVNATAPPPLPPPTSATSGLSSSATPVGDSMSRRRPVLTLCRGESVCAEAASSAVCLVGGGGLISSSKSFSSGPVERGGFSASRPVASGIRTPLRECAAAQPRDCHIRSPAAAPQLGTAASPLLVERSTPLGDRSSAARRSPSLTRRRQPPVPQSPPATVSCRTLPRPVAAYERPAMAWRPSMTEPCGSPTQSDLCSFRLSSDGECEQLEDKGNGCCRAEAPHPWAPGTWARGECKDKQRRQRDVFSDESSRQRTYLTNAVEGHDLEMRQFAERRGGEVAPRSRHPGTLSSLSSSSSSSSMAQCDDRRHVEPVMPLRQVECEVAASACASSPAMRAPSRSQAVLSPVSVHHAHYRIESLHERSSRLAPTASSKSLRGPARLRVTSPPSRRGEVERHVATDYSAEQRHAKQQVLMEKIEKLNSAQNELSMLLGSNRRERDVVTTTPPRWQAPNVDRIQAPLTTKSRRPWQAPPPAPMAITTTGEDKFESPDSHRLHSMLNGCRGAIADARGDLQVSSSRTALVQKRLLAAERVRSARST